MVVLAKKFAYKPYSYGMVCKYVRKANMLVLGEKFDYKPCSVSCVVRYEDPYFRSACYAVPKRKSEDTSTTNPMVTLLPALFQVLLLPLLLKLFL